MHHLTDMQLDLDETTQNALHVAHRLVDMGVPLFVAAPRTDSPGEFFYPNGWETWRPRHDVVDRWKPGYALAMVCGVVYDVIDVDPRNGGDLAELLDANALPTVYGVQATPSGGTHHLIARTHLAKTSKAGKGIDLQAGDDKGEGRGFIFLAPTVRPSKFGPQVGQDVAYTWMQEPLAVGLAVGEKPMDALAARVSANRAPRRILAAPAPAAVDEDDPFEGAIEPWTMESAGRVIRGQLEAVRNAEEGEINGTLGGAARMLGRFVAGGSYSEEAAVEDLMEALRAGGVHSDRWNLQNGKKWTAASVIADGMARGALEPQVVKADPPPVTDPFAPPTAVQPTQPGVYPRLLVESAAVMAYWLQQEMGQGRLSGFFARQGQVVHTPRMNELGYVPAKDDGDANGPAEIRPVSGETLAAKLQFLFSCYKVRKGKEGAPDTEVPAMFPTQAAKTVVNAPEALQGLRMLKGITHTPMVRADGSVLATPGYDTDTGYLFLPGPGVNVPEVPLTPTREDRAKALTLLLEMIEGFPFATPEDQANYLGLLLTPMLREMAPPSYKMFGISAHQPGSGKSLLAEIVGKIHGAVFRSEVPDDEAEWRKQTTSILATTSAPAVVIDNVTGVLKSSVLAGLLTASGEVQDRELGSSRMISARNDRVWIVTGNNMSLGGDLVRRTVMVTIDPDMANPETRTGFRIKDLPRWVEGERNNILWSLLVLIRSWVAEGRPVLARQQSDSFAAWETILGGILAHAGVQGAFDQESGKRAAGGGDDEGLFMTLDHLRERFGDRSWCVADAVEGPRDMMQLDNRDWMPPSVLDRFARGEARGRQAFGYWLKNRLGRWVVGPDGAALVLRNLGMEAKVQRWKIEQR